MEEKAHVIVMVMVMVMVMLMVILISMWTLRHCVLCSPYSAVSGPAPESYSDRFVALLSISVSSSMSSSSCFIITQHHPLAESFHGRLRSLRLCPRRIHLELNLPREIGRCHQSHRQVHLRTNDFKSLHHRHHHHQNPRHHHSLRHRHSHRLRRLHHHHRRH